MNDLQKLALEHIQKMANELDSESIRLSNILGIDKQEFDAETHTYPLAAKARNIGRWAEAILDSED